jgi:hypothetical protein
MGSRKAHSCAQNAQNGFGFDHKDGDDFVNHMVQAKGVETWISFLNVETKEHSKQWMHTH